MTDFYDALETRDAAQREAALMAALPGAVAQAQRGTAAFAEVLKGVDARSITSRTALASLPVTRKHELLERQQASRADTSNRDPFGGYSAIGWRGLRADWPYWRRMRTGRSITSSPRTIGSTIPTGRYGGRENITSSTR